MSAGERASTAASGPTRPGKRPRVAFGSLMTECNHFGGMPIDITWFERQELRRGDALLDSSAGTLGGILATLREADAEPVPLIAASTVCGRTLTADCHQQLKGEMLDRLRTAGPVDGVILALHGSTTAEDADDVEGGLLAAVREIVGPDVPVVATLDCHGHVTEAMVRHADALVAWETYPHRDAYTTGIRGTRLLLDAVAGRCRPAMVLAKVPVLVSGVLGHTEGDGPFAELMRWLKAHQGRDGVLSTSLFLVHPYLDVPDMGGGALVVTDGQPERAAELAREGARRYWADRARFEPDTLTPEAAIEQANRVEAGPVLLVETADCCGGGAAGDSVHTLKALLDVGEAGLQGPALVPVVDPDAAAACHRAGVAATVTVPLGHKLDPQWGTPVEVTGIVERLTDGRFRYSGGFWEGQPATMGPTAVLRVGEIHILIASLPSYDWADEQFRAVGLAAETARYIVVKNPMNFREGYAHLAKASLILDTPGPTPATLRHARHRRMPRPYFPADADVPGLEPTVYLHPPHAPTPPAPPTT